MRKFRANEPAKTTNEPKDSTNEPGKTTIEPTESTIEPEEKRTNPRAPGQPRHGFRRLSRPRPPARMADLPIEPDDLWTGGS